MSINHLITPTRKDIKAARNYLEWSQKKLGEKCNSTEYTINSLETKRHKPTKELLDKLTEVFADEGIKFNPEGGFKIEKDIVKIYDGEECYLKLQNDILKTCSENKEEVLYLGLNDKKSSLKIIAKKKNLYEAGIPSKILIEKNNNYVLGPLEDYRKINKNYFLSKNIVVIYKNKIAFPSVINKKGFSTKTIVINDEGIASQLKEYFYFLWNSGEKVKKSDTKQLFFKKVKNLE